MNKVLDTVVQSCEELGTLQQDGSIFLTTEDIRQCKNINQETSLQQLEEEYRTRTFTNKREEYIKEQLNTYNTLKKEIELIQQNYKELIDKLANKSIDVNSYNVEKRKYNVNKEDVLKQLQDKINTTRSDINKKYYNVEQIQYKDLVNRLFRLQSLDDEKKQFQLNLDTTEQQLLNLMDKRRKVQKKYNAVMVVFLIVSSIFIALFVYYLFSKNTL